MIPQYVSMIDGLLNLFVGERLPPSLCQYSRYVGAGPSNSIRGCHLWQKCNIEGTHWKAFGMVHTRNIQETIFFLMINHFPLLYRYINFKSLCASYEVLYVYICQEERDKKKLWLCILWGLINTCMLRSDPCIVGYGDYYS